MVSCLASEKQVIKKDLTLFVVYDHKKNSDIEQISKKLFEDLVKEYSSIFIEII